MIDTTDLTPRQLREKINQSFEQQDDLGFHVEVVSFGFKYGLPIEIGLDIVMDVRFLPNPHYIPAITTANGIR